MNFLKNNTIRTKILASITIPLFLILVIIFFNNYNHTKNNLMASYDLLQRQTESNIENFIIQMDNSYKMVERLLLPSAASGFELFLQEYERSNRDPAKMDLPKIKSSLDGKMDLYIIDDSGVITHSTFTPAIGIDFKNYPDYLERINKIRLDNSLVNDRLNVDVKTATLRYWAFMPSPDHKYLLELGFVPEGIQDILRELDISRVEKELKNLNPMLEEVRLYNWIGYLYYDPDIAPSPEILTILDRVKKDGTYEIVDEAKQRHVKYRYINLYQGGPEPADPSLMVELTYDTSQIKDELTNILMFNIGTGFISILLCILIIILITGQITKPIIRLNSIVQRFSNKDFHVRSPIESTDEIGKLSQAFNSMADTIQEYSATLENRVAERTQALTVTLAQLRESQQLLVQSERMAILGQLVAGIAHEINTPIASIKSNVDMEKMSLAQTDLTDPVSLQEYIENTTSFIQINELALERIIAIVNSLKTFARLDESDLKEADLHAGIESSLILLNYQIKNRIQIIKEYGELPPVVCNLRQLNQVFMNILVNAVQAIKGNGIITIKTCSDGQKVYLSFKDNGIGIPEQNLDKIFLSGFTTKEPGQGTGLGLAISERIIKQHNGTITVHSIVGEGSEFIITLPVNQIS